MKESSKIKRIENAIATMQKQIWAIKELPQTDNLIEQVLRDREITNIEESIKKLKSIGY